MQITIRGATVFTGVVIASAFLFAISPDRYLLGELKIGGPAYQRIVSSKDFIADLLPPPLFLVEPYLVVQCSRESQDALHSKTKLLELRETFIKRKDYWLSSSALPDHLNAKTMATAKGAEKFWREAFEVFLPSLE